MGRCATTGPRLPHYGGDFQNLPGASWQMRDRRLWQFTEEDVARVTIRQKGKVRQIRHNGPQAWALDQGSQGIIDELAVDQTVRGLTQASAVAWVARGEQDRARYGFTNDGLQITLELKNGEKTAVEFGGEAPSSFPYAAVTLDGQFRVFEFPWDIYHRYVLNYLSAP